MADGIILLPNGVTISLLGVITITAAGAQADPTLRHCDTCGEWTKRDLMGTWCGLDMKPACRVNPAGHSVSGKLR